jgi:hypothetical protein
MSSSTGAYPRNNYATNRVLLMEFFLDKVELLLAPTPP